MYTFFHVSQQKDYEILTLMWPINCALPVVTSHFSGRLLSCGKVLILSLNQWLCCDLCLHRRVITQGEISK